MKLDSENETQDMKLDLALFFYSVSSFLAAAKNETDGPSDYQFVGIQSTPASTDLFLQAEPFERELTVLPDADYNSSRTGVLIVCIFDVVVVVIIHVVVFVVVVVILMMGYFDSLSYQVDFSFGFKSWMDQRMELANFTTELSG